jgi:hypothetical protein
MGLPPPVVVLCESSVRASSCARRIGQQWRACEGGVIDPPTIVLAEAAVFLIAFMRGAFGGGFAIIGIPLLALVMDPIVAGALLAPMFCRMDIMALRYWRPSTWSKPDVAVLVPGLLIGIGSAFSSCARSMVVLSRLRLRSSRSPSPPCGSGAAARSSRVRARRRKGRLRGSRQA